MSGKRYFRTFWIKTAHYAPFKREQTYVLGGILAREASFGGKIEWIMKKAGMSALTKI